MERERPDRHLPQEIDFQEIISKTVKTAASVQLRPSLKHLEDRTTGGCCQQTLGHEQDVIQGDSVVFGQNGRQPPFARSLARLLCGWLSE